MIYFNLRYNKGELDMASTTSDWEKFWDAQTFAIITDRTKPAMKWTASELKTRGKKVYLVDLSEKPDPDSLTDVTALPSGIDRVVIGITKTEPGDIIPLLKKKGVSKIWLHWNTDTEKAVGACQKLGLKCMNGRCPMMYLGNGLSIHGIHRGIAKITGKY
jgi:predicted CoA-binding protein